MYIYMSPVTSGFFPFLNLHLPLKALLSQGMPPTHMDHFGSLWIISPLEKTDITLKSLKSSVWGVGGSEQILAAAFGTKLSSADWISDGKTGQDETLPKSLLQLQDVSRNWEFPLGTHSIELLTPCGCRQETQ